jgi:prepilin-type N-terminal cleavage/methylation domain-containing protein
MRTTSTFRRSAFTLIELLVVISIIAVLAAMLLPAIGMVRDSAKAQVCQSNLRQMGMATIAYSDDWEGMIPPAYRVTWTKIDPMGWLAWTWRGAIEQGRYLGNDQVGGGGNFCKAMGCPVQQRDPRGPVNPALLHGNPANTSGWATYTANSFLTSTGAPPPIQADVGTMLSKIGRTSDVCFATDSFWTINNWNTATRPDAAVSFPDAPHRQRLGVVYLDGHAGSLAKTWWETNGPSWNVAGSDARAFWLGNL